MIVQRRPCEKLALPVALSGFLFFFISVLTGRGITKEQNLTKQNLSFLLGAKQS